ncbi:hypothetical protein M404DRAFT_374111 [Pisolithus tinctorius Marx 270]|uniref:Uncharacterized protein n=1 Tax=Pisolithus tinctorius Marx 270 TaxID=870435 RepID=A0A0C3JA80_PISTI|nr:hypothetical protein M404DRAFT_374111 [Pisolithus tinctorius Marx 270]
MSFSVRKSSEGVPDLRWDRESGYALFDPRTPQKNSSQHTRNRRTWQPTLPPGAFDLVSWSVMTPVLVTDAMPLHLDCIFPLSLLRCYLLQTRD